MYKLIAFDLDGTILDTLGDLENSINHILDEYGFPRRTLDEVRCFVGNGVLKLVERSVPENTSREIILEIFRKFKEFYLSHLNIKSVPYEGVTELLIELRKRGYKIAVVSNKIHPAVVQLCREYFPGLIDFSLGEDPIRPKKPHPAMLEYAIEKMKVTKEETLYIGDSEVDIETALNTGVNYISVDWGFKTHEFLVQHNSQNIVSTVKELLEKID